ncbi:MAG: hypothetical protein J6C77_04270 [Muribaculaceae bacterium]|nr:hypothetical protein [Muribaculaceae bacterium]
MSILKSISTVNWVYILFWGIISFVSSFSGILEGNFDFFDRSSDATRAYAPVCIWIIAFFGDYIYTIHTMDSERQFIHQKWTEITYVLIEIIFIVSLISLFYHTSVWRTISLIILFISIIGLKAASLCVVAPRVRLQKA